MSCSDNIRRYICEGFSTKDLKREEIGMILQSASQYISPNNVQSLEFIVIASADKKEKLANALGDKDIIESPISIAICYNIDKLSAIGMQEFYLVEIASAIQNIIVESNELGLYVSLNIEENKESREILKLPDNIRLGAIVNIGYPRGKCRLVKRFDIEDITYVEEYGRKIIYPTERIEWKGLRQYYRDLKDKLKRKKKSRFTF